MSHPPTGPEPTGPSHPPGSARRTFAYLKAPTPLAFAHRGGAATGDENTIEAFRRAADMGYRYVETDIRATRDGVPVLFHDPTLPRVTGESGTLAALTWRDLATVRVGGAAAIPRLDEVLADWPRLRFTLELKTGDAVGPTAATVKRCGAGDRVLLASFGDAWLAQLRKLVGPKVATSVGRRGVARLRLAALTGTRLRVPESAAAVQVPIRALGVQIVDHRFVQHAHRLGLQVHVWTVDDPTLMHELLDLGVDGIMTDHLAVLREVYRSRGCWHPELD